MTNYGYEKFKSLSFSGLVRITQVDLNLSNVCTSRLAHFNNSLKALIFIQCDKNYTQVPYYFVSLSLKAQTHLLNKTHKRLPQFQHLRTLLPGINSEVRELQRDKKMWGAEERYSWRKWNKRTSDKVIKCQSEIAPVLLLLTICHGTNILNIARQHTVNISFIIFMGDA